MGLGDGRNIEDFEDNYTDGFTVGTPEYDAEVMRQFQLTLPREMERLKRFREGFMQDPSIQAGKRFASEIVRKNKEKKRKIEQKIGELKSSTSVFALEVLQKIKTSEESKKVTEGKKSSIQKVLELNGISDPAEYLINLGQEIPIGITPKIDGHPLSNGTEKEEKLKLL